MKIKAALLALMMAAAAYTSYSAAMTLRRGNEDIPKEIYAQYSARSADAQYVIKTDNGFVAVYKRGQNRPDALTNIESDCLRRADRAMLEKGISAADMEEVLTLLEDLGS